MNNKYYIEDDIFSQKELLWIYHRLINTPLWTLSRNSCNKSLAANGFSSFPGLLVEQSGLVKEEYLSGYFKSIIFRVQRNILKKYSFNLPDKIVRIAVGAKSSLSKTNFHYDDENKDSWTILGFLNPIWNNQDGGHFYIEKEKIEYLPGRFVIFPSNLSHNGGYVLNEKLNYWRLSLNIILTN